MYNWHTPVVDILQRLHSWLQKMMIPHKHVIVITRSTPMASIYGIPLVDDVPLKRTSNVVRI